MNRTLRIVVAVIAVVAVGMASASAAAPAPATNAAAVAQAKRIVRYISNHQVIRMYRALAPRQHHLLSEKKFVMCLGPVLVKIQSETFTKLLAVRTSTRTTIPGYRGVRVLNKLVLFNRTVEVNNRIHHQINVGANLAYVRGAFHWWLTHKQIQACRSF